MDIPTLRYTAKALSPAATETPVKVIGGIRAQTVPAISANTLGFLLGLGNLLLQL
jgi:thiamine monophosphate synthase